MQDSTLERSAHISLTTLLPHFSCAGLSFSQVVHVLKHYLNSVRWYLYIRMLAPAVEDRKFEDIGTFGICIAIHVS